MTNEILLLVIGAVIGIISTFAIELIKHALEKKRLKQERETNSFLAREQDVVNLPSNEGNNKYTPAWLKLVETQNPIIVWRKMTGGSSYVRGKSESTTTASLPSLKTERDKFFESTRSKKAINKYILGRTQIIGRHGDCEIQLSDSSVSRLHAMIRYEQGNYLIYDIGSTSGTFLNGTRVDEMGFILMHQDVIVVGNSVFVFEKIATVINSQNDRKKATKKLQKAGKSNVADN
ncbi:MAG: signaling protein [Anaerolineaceae bacterium]|nr:MAG: signaling protein [Anaerolineaceae bacterium]